MGMNKQAKKLWLKALRSGEYKQTMGQLCDSGNSRCCLGVLYDVAIDGYWVKKYGAWRTERGGSGLLNGYLTFLGLTRRLQRDLWEMNDLDGKNFRQIADWIEENL